ncbi:YopX family protein [Paenibacillus sp. FSL W8-1287]|uniref:YopX family protein n=1 Tax=Paenibacillus sp. FSL W8-1287 TaxID=2954653 RepID=UPI0030CF4C8D
MREYKFRGKRLDNGDLVFGDLRLVEGKSYILDYDIGDDGISQMQKIFNIHHEVDPETVGQYTGLTDRKSKKIYEKATVLITGTQELDYGLTFEWNDRAVVRWSEEECGFYLDVINKREVGLCQDGYFTVDTFPLRKWEEGEWDIEYEVFEEGAI